MEFEMSAQNATAQEAYTALPLRQHTILGVCEGIGEDFGFNPIFLRVPLAAMVLWSPLIAIGTYFALGALVFASRLFFPRSNASPTHSTTIIESDNDRDSLQIAA
jgi:phage shock protein C